MEGLREWQKAALTKYLEENPKDFLAVATPGAGKTTFALRIATELVARRTVDRVIVVVPTEHLKVQWAEAAKRVGLLLDPHFSNSSAINPAYDGVVVTYAQVSMHPYKHHQVATTKRSLVIMDEIHHGGDARSWGDGMRIAYGDAQRRLALTGTPFRSDDSPIPFVTYEEDHNGLLRSKADHSYGYADALRDGVVRPVVFLAYSGSARWRTSAGEEYEARLGEILNAEQTARAWKTALDPKGDWIPAVLQAAHTRLRQLRETIPDAGGLVIATDKQTARAYAKILTQLSSTPVSVILSDDPEASDNIDKFAHNRDEWMVAVRMVSEGVDVPRLAVGVYATSASTPLFFAQAIGRFVRARAKGETASVFLPSVPVLLDLASKMETQRQHVLGQPDRPKEGWDDELLADANKKKNEADALTKSYESIGADAELDSLIYEGRNYGTGAFTGSAEEADYLGLPGLLNAEQMRELLKRRQAEQVEARAEEDRKRREEEARQAAEKAKAGPAVGGTAGPPPGFGDAEIPALRKELNALVSVTASRTGRPHGAIHKEVREQCGGPPTAMCTAQQLRDRIAYLRRW
ncbi:MAG: DEAD/DEAH box helicase [Corynebacterium sp.]|nr:DEAD/DEAH box helicase [Corynebacterium sp.]